MIIKAGDKVHVITRRGFDEDIRRHFAGVVVGATDSIARIEGHTFVLDASKNAFVRRPDRRTRIISLVDAGNVINVIPAETDLESLSYRMSGQGRLVVTDGKALQLDIQEFGGSR